jgi:hypothetical protein
LGCRKNHTDVMEVLLHTGATVDAVDKYDFTPLHLACFNGHENAVRMLLTYGARTDSKNKLGKKPLDYAVKNNHTAVIRLLEAPPAKAPAPPPAIPPTSPEVMCPHCNASTAKVSEAVKKMETAVAQAHAHWQGVVEGLRNEMKILATLATALIDNKKLQQALEIALSSDLEPFVRYSPHILVSHVVPRDTTPGGTSIVPPTSILYRHLEALFSRGGSWLPLPSPVAGYQLVRVDAIRQESHRIAGYESRQKVLQGLRKDGGSAFNFLTSSMSAEQLHTLGALRERFLERSPAATPQAPHVVYAFHGTRVELMDSICRNGIVAMRETDSGYFGLGCYTTLNIEYAARYAHGEFDAPAPRVRTAHPTDQAYPIIMAAVSVGMCYPVTPGVDYSKRGDGMSDFLGLPLKKGFDCHCAAVCAPSFQAANHDKMQYMELVVDQEVQVLPVAVLWVRPTNKASWC